MIPRKCRCTNSKCDLIVELPGKSVQEFDANNWIMLVQGCRGSPPDGYRLIRRNSAYNVYSPDIKSDIEAAIETADIVSDPEFIAALRKSIREMEGGEGIPWEEVKKELGLDNEI